MELAKRVVKYRIQHNLTQKEMSKLLKVSNNIISNIEQNKEITLRMQTIVEMKLDELEK